MATLVVFVLVSVSCVLVIPVMFFFLEVIWAISLSRPASDTASVGDEVRPRVAVLVPAHNESSGLLPTIHDIMDQLAIDDRLVVVADNCSDDTAFLAAEAGAEVVERRDCARIGKGYALDWGFRHLLAVPPEVLVIVDADCRVAAGAIERLARACVATHRPVQAYYKITSPQHSAIDHRFAELKSKIKNWIRPLGLSALGLPCQLLGTGMAFPWRSLCNVDLADGSIVEDIKLGLDLASAGSPPVFCPSAVVSSCFPSSFEGVESQRQRWEHGHLGLIARMAPKMIYKAVIERNFPLLALTLDMAIPPLLLLGVAIFITFLFSSVAIPWSGSLLAAGISGGCALIYGTSVFLCWMVYGREVFPVSAVVSLGPFVAAKFRLYGRLLSGDAVSTWIRTERKSSGPAKPGNSG